MQTFNWYEKNKQKSNAVGAIVQANATGRVLLGCRSVNSDSPLTWCIFGGGIEVGEDPMSALAREFAEEIGLRIALDLSKATPLSVFKSPAKDFAYFTLHLQVASEFIPQLNNEHVGWCWASVNALPRPMHPGCNDTFNLPAVTARLAR